MFSDFSKFHCLLCSPQCEKNRAMAHPGFWPPRAQLTTAQASSHQTRNAYKAQKALKTVLSCALKSKENFTVLLPLCPISPSVLQKINQRSAEAKYHAHCHKAIQQLNSDQKPINLITCYSFQAWWNSLWCPFPIS